uniref:Xylose isomerase n=1 Tax=candidate division WOR-3 bacterium TaxID=2052148 RepID=A0A7C6EIE6_UNCW3
MALMDIREQAIRRKPEELIDHLKNFKLNLKFSAGIWYFSPPDSRFHSKYKKDLDIRNRLDIAEKLYDYGLTGLEAHYPNEINEKNIETWKKFLKSTGMKLVTIVPLLFRDKIFEFGSLSNPIDKVRKKAIELTKRTLQLNKDLNTEFMVVWPGIDGYENPFGIDFFGMWDRFAEGLAQAMDSVPGVRIAFEPKPYEPRGRIIFGTTAEGLLLCQRVESLLKNRKNKEILKQGHKLCCMNPEIGHVMMAYEDLAYAYSLALSEARLAHMHLNSQPPGNFDQDLNIGVIAPEQFESLLFVLKMHSYKGWFGIDINPERMTVETAIKICIDAVRSANDRINELDYESIIYAVNNPDKARGWIEAYLLRKRALYPERLTPLPSLKTK